MLISLSLALTFTSNQLFVIQFFNSFSHTNIVAVQTLKLLYLSSEWSQTSVVFKMKGKGAAEKNLGSFTGLPSKATQCLCNSVAKTRCFSFVSCLSYCLTDF